MFFRLIVNILKTLSSDRVTNAVYVNLFQTRIFNVLMFSSHNQMVYLDCRQIMKIRGAMEHFIMDHLFTGLCCIE